MTGSYGKFYLLLVLLILVVAGLLWREIYATQKISIKEANQPLISATTSNIPTDPSDQIYGNPGASLTLTEFVDLNDADSRRLHRDLAAFVDRYPSEARIIFKHLPSRGFLSDSVVLHQGAFCAGKQGADKFWKFIGAAAITNGKISDKEAADLATANGVALAGWEQCLKTSEAKSRVEADLSLADALGLKKAPALFVNNKRINFLDEINVSNLLAELIKKQ